jgi:signal transduction histidine kinase
VDGEFIRVSITDTGPGIPVEQQQLLFHKFQQAGKSLLTRDATRGTGLGLYISRLLAEKMGGAVSLDHSEPGKGTTFSFTARIAADEQKRSVHIEDEGHQTRS